MAPAAWVLQASLHWFFTSRACADGDPAWGPLPQTGVRLLVLAIALAALAAAAYGLAVSSRAWRELSASPRLTEAHGYGVAEYLSIAGLFISAAFLLAIILTGLPAVMVDVCEGAR